MLDRKSKYPGRVRLAQVSEGVYDMTRADEPEQEGTSLNKNLFDQLIAAFGTTTGTASELALTGDGGFQFTDGATIRFKLHVNSGATPTINVDGTGAKRLMANTRKPMKAGTPAGTWIVATYCKDFDFFVVQGSGTADQLRIGTDPKQFTMAEWLVCGFGNAFYNREWFGGI